MKLRRRKGATLGLVAVSVLVIIMIGVGCFFLAKICGGSREVTNATDAGTLNVARQALRSRDAEVSCPTDFAQMQLADPVYGGMTLYTYNRAVAAALLVALNAQQEGTAAAQTNCSEVYGELTTLGQNLTTALEAQATLQNRFNQVITGNAGANGGNNNKMFGNTTVTEAAYKYQWMKQGGSTNVWFYQSGAGQPSALPSTANYTGNLVSPGAVNFTPTTGGAPNGAALSNKYMVGYSPIQVAVPGLGTLSFVGVPVFPQQNPHLVSANDFTSSPTNYTPPAGGSTPPNAFSVQATSMNTEGHAGMVAGQSALGGSLACAIVGCTMGGVNNVTSPVHFTGSLPGGYILVSNRSAATPPGGFGNPVQYDDSNNIFNHELNAQGNEGDIQSIQSGSQYIFYDNNSSADPSNNGGQVISQWAAYNAAGDPAGAWTWNGNQMNGQPNVPPNIFVTDGAGGAYASTGSGPSTTANINQTQVINALKGMGSGSNSQDCMQWMNTGPNYVPQGPYCAGTSLDAMNAAYNRGNGPGMGAGPSPQMWSDVDNVKAQIINAFHTRSIPFTVTSQPPSGMGSYRLNMTDPEIAADIASNDGGNVNPPARWNGALNNVPLEYTAPGELNNVPDGNGGTDAAVGTTVYAYLNQISGCALNQVITDLTQRCCEISPTILVNGTPQPTSIASVTSFLQNSPPLYMGQNLYICKARPTDPTSSLTWAGPGQPMSQPSTLVGAAPGPAPDGTNVAGTASSCSASYGLTAGSDQPGMIDSKSLNGTNGGDNNLHDQPFMNQSGSVDATDHADFILSSGYQNVLGKLDFYQTITASGGGDQFSRPN